ncbi:hypothetical protein CYLTODRAFT_355393 [Cylindrobasidium torrendii FP15055 ss-10]|uniref:G-protein coupled receptors family 1 profile domain-containing protein n=1 Tax=Cylindrobasidium torrendii FP15055 ss-10 TaxID=1314674 RepID=A0A0D7B6N2_9AGAR|nr:hypothetical protein CYLTODRAFT_355393 [Cylindrobasidium torrendii FP15055 ss-10]
MNIFDFITRIEAYFIKLPDSSLSERLEIADERALVVALPSETLFLFNMVIADAVVIWRAWVLWQGDRLQRLVYIPITFLLATFAYAIVSIQCLGQDLAYIKSTTNGTKACSWGPAISWAISMLTNITSTALIALKAWYALRVREHIFSGPKVKEEKGVKVLLLLIESGFIYSLCWLTQLVVFFDFTERESANILWTICNVFGDQISGLYPTAIIVLTGIQRSISDIEGDDDDDSRRLDLSNPSFSNIGMQSTTVRERLE